MFAPGEGMVDAFQGISKAIDGISLAAASGGFGVTPDAGRSLLNAIDDLHQAVTNGLGKSRMLEQQPPLGETPAAKVYKPFLATVASDPVQGAIPVFKKLQSDLVNARAAIEKAMKNYEANEKTVSENLNASRPA